MAAGAGAALLGLNEQQSLWSLIATLPEIAWEASLGIWLVAKGFRTPAPAGTVRKIAGREPAPSLASAG